MDRGNLKAAPALDFNTEKRITSKIMKLSGNRTLIIVTHRISTIKDCDIIYLLIDEKITQSGKFDQLEQLNKNFNKLT